MYVLVTKVVGHPVTHIPMAPIWRGSWKKTKGLFSTVVPGLPQTSPLKSKPLSKRLKSLLATA